MRLVAIGCEHSGVTTLLSGLTEWGAGRGIAFHTDDHFTIPGGGPGANSIVSMLDSPHLGASRTTHESTRLGSPVSWIQVDRCAMHLGFPAQSVATFIMGPIVQAVGSTPPSRRRCSRSLAMGPHAPLQLHGP